MLSAGKRRRTGASGPRKQQRIPSESEPTTCPVCNDPDADVHEDPSITHRLCQTCKRMRYDDDCSDGDDDDEAAAGDGRRV